MTHASTIPHLMIHSRYRPLEDLWNMSCWKYRIMSDYFIDWAQLWLMRAVVVTMVTHSSVYLKLCRKSSGRKHLLLCYLNFKLEESSAPLMYWIQMSSYMNCSTRFPNQHLNLKHQKRIFRILLREMLYFIVAEWAQEVYLYDWLDPKRTSWMKSSSSLAVEVRGSKTV